MSIFASNSDNIVSRNQIPFVEFIFGYIQTNICFYHSTYYIIYIYGSNFHKLIIVQAQYISFNPTIPADLEVCAEAKTFTLELNNISEGDLNNIEIQLDLPTGVQYITNSFVENSSFGIVEISNSNPYSIILSLNQLPFEQTISFNIDAIATCLLYTSPSPRDATLSRMPSSA